MLSGCVLNFLVLLCLCLAVRFEFIIVGVSIFYTAGDASCRAKYIYCSFIIIEFIYSISS